MDNVKAEWKFVHYAGRNNENGTLPAHYDNLDMNHKEGILTPGHSKPSVRVIND